jgi:hypothetical protein
MMVLIMAIWRSRVNRTRILDAQPPRAADRRSLDSAPGEAQHRNGSLPSGATPGTIGHLRDETSVEGPNDHVDRVAASQLNLFPDRIRDSGPTSWFGGINRPCASLHRI